MTRALWLCVVVLVSASIQALDIVTGRYVDVQMLFVIPVGIGAWYLSRRVGIITAVVVTICRFGIAITVERDINPAWAAVVNTGVRTVVLIVLAALVAAAREKQALARRVQVLEGILPICMFCKKICRPDGTWEQIEAYVSKRSAAQFSHTFCEACGREQYGEYLPPPDSKDVEPGQ